MAESDAPEAHFLPHLEARIVPVSDLLSGVGQAIRISIVDRMYGPPGILLVFGDITEFDFPCVIVPCRFQKGPAIEASYTLGLLEKSDPEILASMHRDALRAFEDRAFPIEDYDQAKRFSFGAVFPVSVPRRSGSGIRTYYFVNTSVSSIKVISEEGQWKQSDIVRKSLACVLDRPDIADTSSVLVPFFFDLDELKRYKELLAFMCRGALDLVRSRETNHPAIVIAVQRNIGPKSVEQLYEFVEDMFSGFTAFTK